MKNSCLRIFIFCFTTLLIASCKIEKRHYLPGYHVTWNHQKNDNPTEKSKEAIQSDFSFSQIKTQQQTHPETNFSIKQETTVNLNSPSQSLSPINQPGVTKQELIFKEHKNKNTKTQLILVLNQTTKKTTRIQQRKNPAAEDLVMLALAIACIILGFPFLAIAITTGFNSEFWINLALFVGAAVCLILGIFAFAALQPFALYFVLCAILLIVAMIQAVIVVVNNT